MNSRADVLLWDEKKKGVSLRPFRLWDANRKKQIPRRCYGSERNAMNAALIEIRWSKIGETIEVFNITDGALSGQYTRKVSSVTFTK